MKPTGVKFEVVHGKHKVTVTEYEVPDRMLYLAVYPNGDRIVVTQVKATDEELLWTCVPEGRQPLASEIGPIIGEYLKLHPTGKQGKLF